MGYDKSDKPGMLTYKDAEPIVVHVPRVLMEPSPRRGTLGRIMDRVLGPIQKPHVVLDKEHQDLLREHLEKFNENMSAVAGCGVTAEQIKEATDGIITLGRGHHIRNADGTVTDVSNDPRYKCG